MFVDELAATVPHDSWNTPHGCLSASLDVVQQLLKCNSIPKQLSAESCHSSSTCLEHHPRPTTAKPCPTTALQLLKSDAVQQHHHMLVTSLWLQQQPQLRPICQLIRHIAPRFELQQLRMVPHIRPDLHLCRVPVWEGISSSSNSSR